MLISESDGRSVELTVLDHPVTPPPGADDETVISEAAFTGTP